MRGAVPFSGKRVLIALAGVFVFLLALGLHYYGRYHPFAELAGGGSEAALSQSALQITDATVTGRTNGHLRWRAQARSITLSRDRSQVTLQGIHDGVLYTASGKPEYALAAGQATYQKALGALDMAPTTGGGYLVVGGGIQGRALRPGGPSLRSDSLLWDASRNEVRSTGSTTATFPRSAQAIGGLKMQADILIWDTARAVLRAPGTVVATFPDGISRVQGDDVEASTTRGDLSLRHLHGTFRVPPAL